MSNLFNRMWGEASAALARTRRFGLVDLVVLGALFGTAFALVHTAREWTGVMRPMVEIDLSPWALPKYTLLSLSRGLSAYVLSLAFTLVYGYWAAKDPMAERVLVPLLDILQSIPVLAFLPPLFLALVAIFPHSNVGLELAAVLMIFTGQAWNMSFSWYYSLKNLPQDMREVATVYRFNRWQTLRQVELPFATIGLVWNSMMSMAGGWFFLTIAEAFQLGNKDFRLPGLGSYMTVAVDQGNKAAMVWAVIAMSLMIVAIDQLLWRPVVVWSQKFRVEEGGQFEPMESWVLDWLRRSELLSVVQEQLNRLKRVRELRPARPAAERRPPHPLLQALSRILPVLVFAGLCLLLVTGCWKLVLLLKTLPGGAWGTVLGSAFATLGRVLLATLLGTIWTIPVGLAIGLSPRLSRVLQPVVQIVASFPVPMLFPAVVAILAAVHVSLGMGSVVLMLLGTQWYILFNVIAGATAIPADLREAARSYRITGFQRFKDLYFPALFPYLVTGWITAAGGAWNTSIVAEYMTVGGGKVLTTYGLGALITEATAKNEFGLLAAGVVVMSSVVVLFNRLVWKRLHTLAETRFSLSK